VRLSGNTGADHGLRGIAGELFRRRLRHPARIAARAEFEAAGDASLSQITNSFSKLQQRASYSRIAWGARGRNRRRGLVN
jgi:hypothetical protein